MERIYARHNKADDRATGHVFIASHFFGKIIYPTSLRIIKFMSGVDVTNISNDVIVSFAFCILACILLRGETIHWNFWVLVYFLAMMLPVTGIIQHGMIKWAVTDICITNDWCCCGH